MGVRGLTTYVNSNQDAFLQQFYLYDSNLVIDGNSLCAQLYRSLNCFSAFGGDYDKFAAYVRKFFKSIRKCNVVPYVIFDGSYEVRKLKTAYSRLRSKISGASRLDPVTQGCLQIFPLLLRYVFKEVLSELEVPYTICEFEADDEIATLARYLNCPVLSYDSDFFIYNVMYIPFNTLEHKPVIIEDNGATKHALECRIYKVEFLTNNFGGLSEELLPLMATLLGNDYVEKKVFKKFFAQLKLPKSRKCKNEQQRSIHGIIKWLQNETLNSAIEKILGRLKKNEKNKVLKIIKQSVDGYKNTRCRSLKYFNLCDEDKSPIVDTNLQIPETPSRILEDINVSDEESSVESLDSSDNESDEEFEDPDLILGIPNWFADGVRNHTIPPAYFNLFIHHTHFCSPQAEDFQEEDSFICSLPILRFAFDILTDFSHENCVYVCRENSSSYKRMFLGKEYSIPRPLDKSFPDLSVNELQSYFYNFFKAKLPKLDLNDIRLLPSDFQLFMLAIVWWVSHCDVPLANIHSLFICYIMLEVIDEKTGTFRGHKYFSNKYTKRIEEIKKNNNALLKTDDELFLNKNKVRYEDGLIAANVLLKHFEIDDSIRKKPKSYDAKRMHSFAQFQCCLLQVNSLNSLCRNPIESTKYHKCFNGTFVYNIAMKLEDQLDPIHFICQYLNGAHTVLKFYKSLCVVFEKISEKMCLTTSKYTGKKSRRKKKKKFVDDEPNSFLVKGFESNVTL